MSEERMKFLRQLDSRGGTASVQELCPQLSQRDNSARQWCKHNGLVIFERPYWHLTDAGRMALTPQQGTEP